MKLLASFIAAIAVSSAAFAAPKVLPFNARLTAADGGPLTNGIRLVLFNIYDRPSGGSPVWAGELHKTSINGGLVSVMLGTKSPLAGVDFGKTLYIEVTVDANGDNQISSADAPLSPRQVLLPGFFARNASHSRNTRRVNGADWTSILVTGTDPRDPGAYINTAKIQPGSLDNSLIGGGTITHSDLAAGAVTDAILGTGAVSLAALKQEILSQMVPTGSIAAFGGYYSDSAIPQGWLLCDGRSVPVAQYPALFNVLSNIWGRPNYMGDSFLLPDLRGRFLRGVSGDSQNDPDAASRSDDHRIMANSGNDVGSIQDFAIRSHTHGITILPGGFLIGVGAPASTIPGYDNPVRLNQYLSYLDTETFHMAPNGRSESRPRNAAVAYIIKY